MLTLPFLMLLLLRLLVHLLHLLLLLNLLLLCLLGRPHGLVLFVHRVALCVPVTLLLCPRVIVRTLLTLRVLSGILLQTNRSRGASCRLVPELISECSCFPVRLSVRPVCPCLFRLCLLRLSRA